MQLCGNVLRDSVAISRRDNSIRAIRYNGKTRLAGILLNLDLYATCYPSLTMVYAIHVHPWSTRKDLARYIPEITADTGRLNLQYQLDRILARSLRYRSLLMLCDRISFAKGVAKTCPPLAHGSSDSRLPRQRSGCQRRPH